LNRFELKLFLSLNFKGEKYEVTLKFQSDGIGVHSAILAFEFKENTQVTTRPFHIVRFIEAEYRSEFTALLGPTAPFRHQKLETYEPMRCNIDEGFPPER